MFMDNELALIPQLLNQFPDLKKYIDIAMPMC